MMMEQVFRAKDEELQSSPGSNMVHLSQPPPKYMDVDVGVREESAKKGSIMNIYTKRHVSPQ